MPDPAASSLRGTFSSPLKNRPVWKVMGPVITACVPMLEECDLQESDFDFDLGNSQHLKVLLLSQISVQDSRQETITRLKRFSCIATGPHRKAIAFLLTEEPFGSASGRYDLKGLLALQVLMAETLPDHLPTIPVPDSSCFTTCVQEYLRSLANLPPFSRPLTDTVSLLHHMRAPSSPSLPEQDTNVLSDLYPSLKSLSQAIRTQEGRFVLDEYLGSQLATDIAQFWKEDHIYE